MRWDKSQKVACSLLPPLFLVSLYLSSQSLSRKGGPLVGWSCSRVWCIFQVSSPRFGVGDEEIFLLHFFPLYLKYPWKFVLVLLTPLVAPFEAFLKKRRFDDDRTFLWDDLCCVVCVFRISVADAIIIFEPRSSFFLICDSSFCLFLLLLFACLGSCVVNTEGEGEATLVGLTFPLSPPLSSLCRGRGGIGKQGRGITRQRKMIGVSKERGKRTISYTRAGFQNKCFSRNGFFHSHLLSLSLSVWHLGAKRASSSFSFQGKRVCKLFLTPIITFPPPLPPFPHLFPSHPFH